VVAAGVDANITLDNLSIVHPVCAFAIADSSTGDVTVTLVGNNTLQSDGNNCAGLQKNGSGEDVGTLPIVGEGSLTATGGQDGAGIGVRTTAATSQSAAHRHSVAVIEPRASAAATSGDGVNITITAATSWPPVEAGRG
jgi:hypothetical protein